jgi:hypothetical protein
VPQVQRTTRSLGSPFAAFLAAGAVLLSASCTSADGNGNGSAEGACAYRVEYRDHMYGDLAPARFETGERLGRATRPTCDDSPGDGDAGEETSATAYAVVGVDPSVAITLEGSDVLVVALERHDAPPPEVTALLTGPVGDEEDQAENH